MNKLSISCAIVALSALYACSGSGEKATDVNQDSILLSQSREQLAQTVAMQDSLFALINEIGADMAQIKQMEKIVSVPGNLNSETPSRRDQLKGDIASISQALQERRERLSALEKKLRDSNNQNTTMLSTIETLKAQIAQQEQEIATLRNDLAAANNKISSLNTTVDSLNVSVATERTGRERAQEEAANLNTELNTVFYAIGTKSELEQHNIIKSGFLRKTKIMQGDYETSYFTKVNKQNFKSLPLHSKKAKVLSNQPTDSYQLTDGAGGQKVLTITNPTRFWAASNFLIIQID